MPQRLALLDTDILSELLKNHPLVTERIRRYLAEHSQLAFSIITQYEILRGLKAKQARAQEAAFSAFCQVSLILPLTDQVVERAATLYGELYRRGELLADADLLIAATALDAQRMLITNNLVHFSGFPIYSSKTGSSKRSSLPLHTTAQRRRCHLSRHSRANCDRHLQMWWFRVGGTDGR